MRFFLFVGPPQAENAFAREVHNGIKPLEPFGLGETILDVPLDVAFVFWLAARREKHLIALQIKRLLQPGANESGRACDEDSH